MLPGSLTIPIYLADLTAFAVGTLRAVSWPAMAFRLRVPLLQPRAPSGCVSFNGEDLSFRAVRLHSNTTWPYFRVSAVDRRRSAFCSHHPPEAPYPPAFLHSPRV